MSIYVKVIPKPETFAIEIKDFMLIPGVSALKIIKDILPELEIADAEFITRDEYMADYGEDQEPTP